MNKRVVILWVCFFVWAVSLMAQDVPGGVVAAFKKRKFSGTERVFE